MMSSLYSRKVPKIISKLIMLSSISVTLSRQQKNTFLISKNLLLTRLCQLRVLRQMREAHSMIADLTIEVETLEQTRSDYPDYSLQDSVHKAESRLNDLRSVLRQSSISRDNNVYSKMKTIQCQIMRLSITKDMGETLSNSDKPCESRCSHVHSDSNHYHVPKIELPKFYGDGFILAEF